MHQKLTPLVGLILSAAEVLELKKCEKKFFTIKEIEEIKNISKQGGQMNTKKEEYLSKKRAVELWDKGILNQFEVGTFKGLQQIHQYLFKDVFSFAGEIRNVNLIKGNFRFTPSLFLKSNIKTIEKMPEDDFDKIIQKYTEMNIAHPFRNGNGRATRIRLDLILKKNLKKCADWQKIDKMEYMQAIERSPVNALELKYLLKKALTENIGDRDIFIGGIQRSFQYENQDYYKIYDINK